MGKLSRNKGKRGEREVAKLLSDAGFPAYRAVQYKGTAGSADVTCPSLNDRFHIEVKRVEERRGPTWIAQAKEDAPDLIPLIFLKQSRKPWRYLTDDEGMDTLNIPMEEHTEVLFRALWKFYGVDPINLEPPECEQ